MITDQQQSPRRVAPARWAAGVAAACGAWALCLLVSPVQGQVPSAAAPATEPEKLPASVSVTRIEAYPTRIELQDKFAYRQLLVLGHNADGETIDLTRLAAIENVPQFVQISAQGLVRPVANGDEELTVRYGEFTARVPCHVEGLEVERKISFVTDVQPAFSRMSCNAGTCHGSKDGKNGFKLSLRGYDALYDHRALTDDIAARRFNRAAPDQSLFLLKATGSIAHVGGVRTRVGEPYYEIMRAWIAQGCQLDLDATRVASIEVLPHNPIVPLPEMKQQMVVLATYTDGRVRDVTQEAFIESGNTEVVAAGEGGVLKMLRRGEAPVLVRYEGAYAATTMTVMGDRQGFTWSNPPEETYIDQLVYAKLRRVKVLPSELCTDDQFIRRVSLDLTGLPPTTERLREFLQDPRPQAEKRAALVDELIGSPAYVEQWTNKWADLLQVNRKFLGEEGSIALRNWIKNAVAANMPYNEFAHEILTASGSTIENPPASYYKILRSPEDLMENTTHLFLAIRFNCNKCHDHPFERWTQDQYYHLAAYFAQVGLKEDARFAGQRIGGSAVEGAKPLVEVVFDRGSGEVTHDRTKLVAPPVFPFDFGSEAQDEASRRRQLADWMTSADNPYFARSYVNRLWGYLFGIGIIEPIDDIRAGNPASNPELLDALTKDFVESGFDIQHMLRTICLSRTYQHSVVTNVWNEDDKINYSHTVPRRLSAEVLFDAIHFTTGARPQIPGVPAGFRASMLPDAGVSIPFLDDFGRPARESACECERSSGMVLGPIMKLVNGPTIGEALTQPDNALASLVAEHPDNDAKVVEEIFLRILSRLPTEAEQKLALEAFDEAGEDLALLRQNLATYEAQLDAQQTAWEKQARTVVTWTPLVPTETKSDVGAQFTVAEDGTISVTGNQGKDVYTLVAPTSLSGVTGLRLEALPDDSLPAKGPGRADNGNFVLNELRLSIAPKADPGQTRMLSFASATADFSQASWDVKGAVDGDNGSGWAVAPAFGAPHTAVFELKEPATTDGEALLTLQFDQQFPDGKHALGKFRLSVTASPRPLNLDQLPKNIQEALAAAQPTDAQRAELTNYFRGQDAEWQRLKKAVTEGETLLTNRRLVGVQDLAWALINTPSFLFNR